MTTYTLEKTFDSHVELSPHVRAVANMFGLGVEKDRPIKVVNDCEVQIKPGQVVYVTGGSGAGKSLLLELLKEQFDDFIDVEGITLPEGKALVDCFGEQSVTEALNWLSVAGLSDAFAILRKPKELSDGQRYRFRLALALAQKPPVIFIDEFCSMLDRVTAAVVAHNVRRFADKFETIFIVATSHDDLLEDLCPDVVLVKHLGSHCDVYYPSR